jgi:hypothetical protein
MNRSTDAPAARAVPADLVDEKIIPANTSRR